MKLNKLTDYIFQYDDVVDSLTCDEIVNNLRNGYLQDQEILNRINSFFRNDIRYNNSHNLTKLARYNLQIREVDTLMHKIFSRCHLQYMKDNVLLGHYLGEYISRLECDYIHRFYNSSDYYDWHIDKSSARVLIVSYILYLNDAKRSMLYCFKFS